MASHVGCRRRSKNPLLALLRVRSVKYEFGLEYLTVLAFMPSKWRKPSCTRKPNHPRRIWRLGASRRKDGVSALHAGSVEGMVLANNIVRTLLSICSQIEVGQVLTGYTLVSRGSRACEHSQKET